MNSIQVCFFNLLHFFQIIESMSDTYDAIYGLARNGFTGDSKIWDRIYEYIAQHPTEFLAVVPPRKWSIGHQLIFHGVLFTFKKILSLYNETNPIDIFSPTRDEPRPNTILDIAMERRKYYPEQYENITCLCAQDKFIRACKVYDWAAIDEMLSKDPKLLNQKPCYYSNYFVHYLVLHKDVRKFAQYNLAQNRLQLDLQNADGKTPLELAQSIGAQGIVAEIESLVPKRREPASLIATEKSVVATLDNRDGRERSSSPSPDRSQTIGSAPPGAPQAAAAAASTSTAGASVLTPARHTSKTDSSATTGASTRPTGASASSASFSTQPRKTPCVSSGSSSLATIPIDEVLKRVTCPLTGKVFDDPVIATDGLTYDRTAIDQHIRENRYSPATGEVLDDIFTPNDHVKRLINTLRTEKVIP